MNIFIKDLQWTKLFPMKSGGLLVDLPCANPPLASPDMIKLTRLLDQIAVSKALIPIEGSIMYNKVIR